MLRERRKNANYKPNRRLDRKSSRGMIYENEELRLRTININAEVEQGRSDIRKLRRENEQLKKEIWSLRDEYERVNKKMAADRNAHSFHQNDSQSEESDASKLGKNHCMAQMHKSIEADAQKLKCREENELSYIEHSTYHTNVPLDIVEENSSEKSRTYENFYQMLKNTSAINSLSKRTSQLNSKVNGSLVGVGNQIPDMGQLSVLAEENLTSSGSSSSMQLDLGTDGLIQCSGNDFNVDRNVLMQHEQPNHERNHDLFRLISKIDSEVNDIHAARLICHKCAEIKENMPCKCKSYQNDIPKHLLTSVTEGHTEKPNSEKILFLASPPDLFVTNALASSYQCAGRTNQSSYDCRAQRTHVLEFDSDNTVEDDVQGGLLDELEARQTHLETIKSSSQDKNGNSEALFTSKVFRSEINLLVSCDGLKPNIFPIERQTPYVSRFNVNSTKRKTSLQTLIQNLPEVLATSKNGTNTETKKHCSLQTETDQRKFLRMSYITSVDTVSEIHCKRNSSIRYKARLSAITNDNNEMENMSEFSIMTQSSPDLSDNNPAKREWTANNADYLRLTQYHRTSRLGSSNPCQQLQSKTDESNNDVLPLDNTHYKNSNQFITSFMEWKSRSLVSSTKSSTCQSTPLTQREVSEASSEGDKIPWCACWGNGCL